VAVKEKQVGAFHPNSISSKQHFIEVAFHPTYIEADNSLNGHLCRFNELPVAFHL
jgi:hypothetical protein